MRQRPSQVVQNATLAYGTTGCQEPSRPVTSTTHGEEWAFTSLRPDKWLFRIPKELSHALAVCPYSWPVAFPWGKSSITLWHPEGWQTTQEEAATLSFLTGTPMNRDILLLSGGTAAIGSTACLTGRTATTTLGAYDPSMSLTYLAHTTPLCP